MSGERTSPTPGGPLPGVASDQSMEDILASIRRILNEDETREAVPATPTQPAERRDAGRDEAEPLLLTEEMMVSAPEDPPPPSAEPPPPPAPASAAPEPAPAPPATAERPEALLAPAAAAAAAASVSQLLRAVTTERSAAVSRGGPTIEEVVREEIRPLLKAWLDAHLPAMVERLVRAEIERVIGRALS